VTLFHKFASPATVFSFRENNKAFKRTIPTTMLNIKLGRQNFDYGRSLNNYKNPYLKQLNVSFKKQDNFSQSHKNNIFEVMPTRLELQMV